MVLFSMDAFYVFNIVFLVIGPLSAIGLIAWVMLASKQHSSEFVPLCPRASADLMPQRPNLCRPPAITARWENLDWL